MLRVIIIHLRVLAPQPLPPALLSFPRAAAANRAVPPARKLWSPKGDSEFCIMFTIITVMLLIMVIISSYQVERPPAPSRRLPLPQRRKPRGPGPGGRSLDAASSASPHPSLIHLYVYYLDPSYSSRSTAFRWAGRDAADCDPSLK